MRADIGLMHSSCKELPSFLATCSQHCGSSSSAVRLGPMRAARSAQLSAIRCRWPGVGFFTRLNKAKVSLSLVAAFLCSSMTARKIGTTSAAITAACNVH